MDILSGGRLTVGIGVGGRTEDYNAVGADLTTQTIRGMAERVAIMKRVWASEQITESVLPVGPAPVQAGGPPLLVGTIGPKTVRSASAWADGLAGTTLDVDIAKQSELFDVARAAWAEVGKPKPHLATSFWFALGSTHDARQQVNRHLRRYMNWIPAEYIDAMVLTTGFAVARTNWSRCCESSKRSAPTRSSSFQPVPTSANFAEWPTWSASGLTVMYRPRHAGLRALRTFASASEILG